MNHQQEPTLTPADVPLHDIARLADNHRSQAEAIAQNARDRLAQNDLTGAVARYEAALARFQMSSDLERRLNTLAATIAETHAKRAKGTHTWPIEHLENTTVVYREPGPEMPAEFLREHPRWGVEGDGGDDGQQTYISVTPAAEHVRDLHGRGPLILHVHRGAAGYPEKDATESMSVWVSGEQWNALNALAQRIGDRVPVPYDAQGSTVTHHGRPR